MNDPSLPPNIDEEPVETTHRPTPSAVYLRFNKLLTKYLHVGLIGLLLVVGTALTVLAYHLDEKSFFFFHFVRDLGIAALVAGLIAIVYETSARMRFERTLMTGFLGAVIADWSRQDVWEAMKSQFLEKKVIREHFRVGVPLLADDRVGPGQMLLKLNVEYELRGLRSEPTPTTIEHFLDWHFKIKGQELPRFNCVNIAGKTIPRDPKYFNDKGEFTYATNVSQYDLPIPVTSLREEVVYFPGTHCFVLNEITKGIEICLDEIPPNIQLFVTVRPHKDLKYKELKLDSVDQHIFARNLVLFPGQIIELLFQPSATPAAA